MAANDISGSISNTVGAGGVVGKCEQEKVRGDVKYFLFGVIAGKLRPLGRPNTNAVKYFNAVELMNLLADREWLDDATKTIGQFWKRKNARRNGLHLP